MIALGVMSPEGFKNRGSFSHFEEEELVVTEDRI